MWAGVVVFGALLAVVDRRQIRHAVFGLLLVIGIVAGFIIERVSPFSLAWKVTTWRACSSPPDRPWL